MKVLITGDRDWKDRKAIATILGLMASVAERRDPSFNGGFVTVIHGDCPTGADHMADTIAKNCAMGVRKFPADWDNKGRAAGPIRNSEMLKEKPDFVFGFHNNIRNSKGTVDMLKKAKKAGIPTFLISTEFE